MLIISTSFAYLEFIFADVPGNLIPFLYRAIEHFGVSVIFNILVEAYPLPSIVEDVVSADRRDADNAASLIKHILHITLGGRFGVRFNVGLPILLFGVLDRDVLG